MKAIIMAGGVGSRLRPMTCDCPKPMVPLLDTPVMEYAIRLLRRHKVREAAATLCYLPEQVTRAFGDGSDFGVSLRYYTETEPLGTAGGVKRAQAFLDETFCVLSGDGLTDCDLSAALQYHREKGAMATIVLKRADAPTEYGVAIAEPDGRIRKFLEKPDWSDVFSDLVNTGIYILEPEALRLVPEGCPFDFSKQLFPEMMRLGLPIYGYETRGYWCDIGDIDSYLAANRALLDGAVITDAGLKPGGVIVSPGAKVSGGAILEAPIYIGPGAVIEDGARIGAHTVIGAGARIERGASVKRAVLWTGARLERGAQASGCVLADGALLGESACAYEGGVLGSRSVMEARSALMPGVRVWPRKRIGEYARVETDMVWGGAGAEAPRFRDGRLCLFDPAQAARLGQSLAEEAREGVFLIGRDMSAGSAACARSISAGLSSCGARVLDAGCAFLPALRLMGGLLCADRCVFVSDGRVLPLLRGGTVYPRAEQRRLEAAFRRERVPSGFSQIESCAQNAGRADLLYLGDIAARFGERGGERSRVMLHCASAALLSFAEQAFLRAGYEVRAEWDDELTGLSEGETGVWLDAEGEKMRLADRSGRPDEAAMPLLYAWTALETGEKTLVEPSGSNWAAERLAERYGARVERAHSGSGEEQAARMARSARLHRLYTDGIYAALCALHALSRKGATIAEWERDMPRVSVRARRVPVDSAAKGRVLRALSQAHPEAELGDGARIQTERGRVWVRPSSDRAECLVHCESPDAEFAKELCDFYSDRVERAAKNRSLSESGSET